MKKENKFYDYSNIKSVDELRYLYNIKENKSKSDKDNIILEDNNKSIKRFVLFDYAKYKEINDFKCQGVKVDYIFSDDFSFDISNDKVSINNGNGKKSIDIHFDEFETTLIYCKSGYQNEQVIYLLNKFIDNNFIVINDPKIVQISSNKLLTAKFLQERGIHQPKYVVFKSEDCEKDVDKDKFFDMLSPIYPTRDEKNAYVCKLLSGHGGHGVFVCTESNILSVLQCMFTIMKNTNIDDVQNIMVQEKLDFEEGDLRAYVVNINGNTEIINCVMRKKDNHLDFRTNLSLGNSVTKYALTADQEEDIKRVAKKLGLGFAGVDLCIEKKSKELYVIEINGAPGAPVQPGSGIKEKLDAHEKLYTDVINIINQYK